MRTRFRGAEVDAGGDGAPRTDAAGSDAVNGPGDLFRLLATVTHIGLLQHDRSDAVVSVNDEAVELVGLTAEDLAGYGWRRMWYPDDLDTVLGAYLDCRTLGTNTSARVRAAHPVRGLRWVDLRIVPLLDDAGSPLGCIATLQDVTDNVTTRQQSRRLLSIIEDTTDLLMVTDVAGQTLYLNAAARSFFGVADDLPPSELRLVDTRAFLPAWADERFEQDALPTVRSGQVWSGELALLAAGGDELPISQVLVAHRDASGAIEYMASISRDISERKGFETRLAHQATHDALTGLPNRVLLLDRLKMAMARVARHPAPLAVLFCDLDNFKVVNDSLGHDVGDALLRTISDRIRDAVRPSDTVARFGGDEFVVLCDQLATESDAIVIAERLAMVITEPVGIGEHEIVVSTSLGIAFARTSHDRPEALIRDADVAMYRAKEKGRNRIEVFDDEMRARAMLRLDTERALRRALERRELRVFYQPKVEISTGVVCGFEALLRWEHPERGLMAPGEFISLAEETGLIVPIGSWVLSHACRQMQLWRAVYPEAHGLELSVNLSARQVAQPDLVSVVADVLADTGLDPQRLELEMTESALMANAAETVNLLRALKGLGVRLAVDDFGTGYSSLAYLRRFPVDVLKIDREFITRLGEDHEDTEIVRLVTMLARSLGLQVVAEGVEHQRQLDVLQELGCDRAQGFLLSRPLSAAGVDDLLASIHGHADA
ncbi:MAG: putative diguanylate cyclase/phosphodiesterase & domain with sensor(s) [Acidimicrobiia bacterium]|nr:putative diguanylate cyclase/phosphodiesterase & domain with sensor(s) [Acidimicrobiia bacterium]